MGRNYRGLHGYNSMCGEGDDMEIERATRDTVTGSTSILHVL